MAAFAVSCGNLGPSDVAAWLASLEAADADGRLFLSSVPILTTALLLR